MNVATKRKRRRNLWPFDSFTKSTVYHLRGRQRGVKESTTTRYKGYAIYRRAEGFTVPALDRESIFDDAREAKRFIDAMSKHRNPRALSVPEKHQLKIARATLKMPDAMVRVMGGPTKAEAQEIIRRLTAKNPTLSLPRNKFVKAKVRIKGGKIQVLVDESLLGHAGASGHVSLNPRRRKARKKNSRHAQLLKADRRRKKGKPRN